MANSHITLLFESRYQFSKVYEYFCIMKIPRFKLLLKKPLKFHVEELPVTSTLSDTIYLYFILNYCYHYA